MLSLGMQIMCSAALQLRCIWCCVTECLSHILKITFASRFIRSLHFNGVESVGMSRHNNYTVPLFLCQCSCRASGIESDARICFRNYAEQCPSHCIRLWMVCLAELGQWHIVHVWFIDVQMRNLARFMSEMELRIIRCKTNSEIKKNNIFFIWGAHLDGLSVLPHRVALST